ncbi:hypothetical protein [Thermus thermamylovorans]|uniref:Uncharacterized protein n=1 Tax=Thermus thermamylovorans TaxID=2509362 RepID=A0A4Q9B4R4_9DEIN|nr:hypothetical protein [Thermus thermamylovorans]TBH20584.1 hypothetical protein ETP66_05800 [Thermus thermamylovorans]
MGCLLLATLLGSALFAGLGEVAVGRLLVEGGHRALVLGPGGAYALGEGENSALYGLAPRAGGYLAVGHLGEGLLWAELDGRGKPLAAFAGGQGILWGTDGRFAWGGHRGPGGWEALALAGRERALRLPLPGEGYAYGGFYRHGTLFLVGRVAGPGGFDAFFLGLRGGRAWGYRSGFPGNDYLRFLGERGAVGRLEVEGDSEGLLLDWRGLQTGEALLVRRPGFVYLRAWQGPFLAGEVEVEGVLQGLWIGPLGARYGGGPMASLRALDPPWAYGYSYRPLFQGEGLFLNLERFPGRPLGHRLEALRLPWRPFRLRGEPLNPSWRPVAFQALGPLPLAPCPDPGE